MALTQINLLTHGQGLTSVTTKDTASIAATAGRPMLIAVAYRSTDLATMAGEVITVAGLGGTWEQLGSNRTYDVSSRMVMAVFKGTGLSGSGVLTLSTVSGRSVDRQYWIVTENQDSANDFSVQTPVSATGTGAPGVTLSAFGAATNFSLLFVITDANNATFTADGAHTTLLNGATRFCSYLGSEDTTPGCTQSGSTEWAAFGLEIKPGFPAGVIAAIAAGENTDQGRDY